MMSFGPFKAAHLSQLAVQDAQRWTLSYMSPALMMTIEGQWSNTVFRDGRPICCGGVIEQRPDYGILWSFVGSDVTPYDFRTLHHLVSLFIADLPYRRLEMHVDTNFRNGHRWAKALGFTCEAYRMRGFLLNGGDASLYARVTRG
jgi:hypothetical protein